jgi:hypothetical protein
MPWQRCSAPARQQSESLIQAGQNQFGSEHGSTSRRKLNRERDAVEVTTDGSNRSKVLAVRGEVGVQRPRPGNEKLYSAVSEDNV